MLLHRKVSFFNFYLISLQCGLLLLLLSSCFTVPKRYPHNKPFVFKTNISVTGNMPAAEKQELVARLQNQLDDSLKTRVVSYAGFYKEVVRPPAFDTNNVIRSRSFMEALLHAEGYFYPVITDTFQIIEKNSEQRRVIINFQVTTGKRTYLDSVGYDLLTPELQDEAVRTRANSLLRKGDPFSLSVIAAERDRLLQAFHNVGFYKVSGDDIYAERDTVVAALIDPSLDPFEQIRLLDSLRRKRENPTINVVFKQREAKDTTHLKRFHIGTVKLYPEQSYLQDSAANVPTKSDTVAGYGNNFMILYNTNKFKLPFLARNVFLRPGSLYRERQYFRTVNTFNRLGAWGSNVELTLKERYDSIPLLDAEIRLYPSPRYNLKTDLELSRNIADYLTTSQLFGIGVNFIFTNRNAFRESIQTSTNARFGIELGSNFIQTLQANLSHSIYFPRIIKPGFLKLDSRERVINPRTVFNINGAYTIRRDVYNVSSLNTSWAYEWAHRIKRDRQVNFILTIPNVEFTLLQGKDSLRKLIERIPSLRYAFNDGFVIGIIAGVNYNWNKSNRISNIKLRVEESGALAGFFRNLENDNLFRFVKTDIEFKNSINYKRSGWAFRAFAGLGYVYGKRDGLPENKLPFFKAYFAGGPYSMRAWQVRQLGPGSSLIYDTLNNQANDRFGNMQLEGNVEYRFNLTTIAGVKLKSALFIDAGNIWGIEFEDAAATKKIPEATFNFSRLYKDIAVGGGVSLRFDFDYFLIRLDWAYKLKNPRFSQFNNGWFYDLNLFNGQFQLGIGYPF